MTWRVASVVWAPGTEIRVQVCRDGGVCEQATVTPENAVRLAAKLLEAVAFRMAEEKRERGG